jgi:Mlc titration factor MtfA (ptsG expression regulator)
MELLAVVGVVFVLMVLVYVGVSAVLRRIPAPSLRLPTGPIPDAWPGIVERNVPLVRGLSSDERERLLQLVQVFLADKHFEGCGGLTLTEEMKVTIAAEACLLLLHLEGPCYPTLRTVLVYPQGFVPKIARSPRTGEIALPPVPEMGESWRDGVVVISWADTVRGARNAADGGNVVLHEFAHQLDAEDGVTDGVPILAPGALRTWGGVLSAEYERLHQDAAHDRASVLDSYGATNRAEFFAVATETFFEKPVQLEREHPELYGQLQQFYRQDPARRTPSPPSPPPPPAVP